MINRKEDFKLIAREITLKLNDSKWQESEEAIEKALGEVYLWGAIDLAVSTFGMESRSKELEELKDGFPACEDLEEVSGEPV